MADVTDKSIECLILGVGNILWADEGFGVRAVERFNELFEVTSPKVRIEDGGTLGMYLLEPICETRKLLILDCCDFHGKGAELRILRDDDVRAWSSTKISPHQTGMNDILAAAMLLGKEPEEIAVVGLQPALLDDYGGSLSPEAKAQLTPAAVAAKAILEGWGIVVKERTVNSEAPELSHAPCLNLETYETTRPSEDEAYRFGDARFINEAIAGMRKDQK